MTTLDTILCPKCGHQNDPSAMNCANCRINLEWALENWDALMEEEKKQGVFPSGFSTQAEHSFAMHFSFNADDLRTNREGLLSPNQENCIAVSARIQFMLGTGLGLLIGIFFLKLFIIPLLESRNFSLGNLFVWLFFFIFPIWLTIRARKTWQAGQSGIVNALVGEVTFETTYDHEGRPSLYLCIDGHRFEESNWMKNWTTNLFTQQAIYRAYYCPGYNKILSIELAEN